MSRQVKKVNISGKEDKSNKVSSWSNTTTDTNYPSEKLVKDSLDGKASSTHNHTVSNITDFPTTMTPSSHAHGNLQNNGQVGSTAQANKNVVTDSSGKITTEDKPTIPSASSTTPSADTTSGSVGTGTTWARSNHTHPKSSLYAESSHSHTKSQISDFPNIPSKTSDLTNDSGFLTSHQDISGKLDKAQTSYKGKNVVVDSSSGNITFEEKNNHTHSNYLTSTDISGKIDTAGTGLSKSGTTLNHSNSVTALTTASLKKVKYDAQGHITGTSDVSASDLPSHTHDYSTFSGSYSDLTNKPSYTPTITSSTTGAYKLGSINISGSSVDIYGKDTDTHQSLTNYLQTTDVKDNLTSTDTNKPLSAKQGKELKTLVDGKQATLVSGTSIKTVNNESLLGSGNISIDVEYVVGTHGTTATSTWTGTCSKLREIKDGTIIYYYLTSAGVSGTNVTLNLTLSDGTTTGAKNVYFKGTTRLTTQYPINSIVALVYTTKKDSGAWYVASANDNNSYNAQEYGGVQVIYGEAVTNTILCGAKATDKKYYKLASGLVLDTSYPIIYTNTTPSANTNSNNLYNKKYDAFITNTKSISLTTGKPVYLEGTSYIDGKFTVSSNVITQTLTSGNYYWLIGHAYDETHFRMGMYETIYYYNGTNLEKVSDKTSVIDIIDTALGHMITNWEDYE